MPYLLTAIFFGSLFAILFKAFQRKGVDALQAITINYAVALIPGIIINTMQKGWDATSYYSIPLLPAFLIGFFMMGGFVTMNYATRSHGVAVSTIAARISFVVPVLCTYLFLDGKSPDWVATLLVGLSLIFIFTQKRDTSNPKEREWVFPILVFICYGLANFLLKYAQQQIVTQYTADSSDCDAALRSLTTMTFAAALLCSIIFFLFTSKANHRPITLPNTIAGIVLGICNMGCTYFLLKSLSVIEAALFYPIYNIAIVLIATITGKICFSERLSSWQYAGTTIAIIAIILFFV